MDGRTNNVGYIQYLRCLGLESEEFRSVGESTFIHIVIHRSLCQAQKVSNYNNGSLCYEKAFCWFHGRHALIGMEQ